ncbi:MAG: heavy-metal-associated domain-containing protein [Patescibacteria group bacterium]|mgnify:CR=1 FL=1
MSKIVAKKLKITGMHCSSCAMSIDMDLEDLDGLQEARTSFAKQETDVVYDEEIVDLPKILDQIRKTGYLAQE